jgi:predicted RNA-binding Zn ribbon-like protein
MSESRQPAPEPLRIVEEFVNTLDIETNTDRILFPADLAAWLGAHGYTAAATAEDVERATAAREGLRALLAANAGLPADQAAIDALNAALAPVTPHFGPDGADLEPGQGGLEELLCDTSQALVETMADGSWARLKVCRSDDCRWAFYDRSKNRSGAWCTMAVCGSREKVRAYRARHAD